jgi:RimJ/RimL family protein N-acetyltransferase
MEHCPYRPYVGPASRRSEPVALDVREMEPSEADLAIDYFLNATPEHLEMMGVDPTRLPSRDEWRRRIADDRARPIEQRRGLMVLWLRDGAPVGFSTCSDAALGEHAKLHLHVLQPEDRNSGVGAPCVKRSAEIYFERLQLKRLYSEPNAFNVAPNRTLQKAGFKYVKTYMTVPGWINFHQPVTRWVLER